jgi:hypothetical protein
MKLRDFALLTDENLDPEVVQWLCDSGFNVMDVMRDGLQGAANVDLLRRSVAEQRVSSRMTPTLAGWPSCRESPLSASYSFGRDTLIRSTPLRL